MDVCERERRPRRKKEKSAEIGGENGIRFDYRIRFDYKRQQGQGMSERDRTEER
jgi:hypothetical protein